MAKTQEREVQRAFPRGGTTLLSVCSANGGESQHVGMEKSSAHLQKVLGELEKIPFTNFLQALNLFFFFFNPAKTASKIGITVLTLQIRTVRLRETSDSFGHTVVRGRGRMQAHVHSRAQSRTRRLTPASLTDAGG